MNSINITPKITYLSDHNPLTSLNGLRGDDDIEISFDDDEFEDTGEDWFHYNSSTGKSWTTSPNNNIFDRAETWWKSRDWNKVGQNVVNFFDNMGNRNSTPAPSVPSVPGGDLPKPQRIPFNPNPNEPSFFKRHRKKVIGLSLITGVAVLTIIEAKKAKKKKAD